MPGMSETPATAALVRNLRASAEDADLIEETEWAALFRAAADALGDRTAIGEGDMPDRLSERAELINGVDYGACLLCGAEPGCDIDCPLCRVISRLDRLRALLREYGRHQPGCSAEFNALPEMAGKTPYRCRCGWDEARKELEGK